MQNNQQQSDCPIVGTTYRLSPCYVVIAFPSGCVGPFALRFFYFLDQWRLELDFYDYCVFRDENERLGCQTWSATLFFFRHFQIFDFDFSNVKRRTQSKRKTQTQTLSDLALAFNSECNRTCDHMSSTTSARSASTNTYYTTTWL
jgi:hypothetical protein